MSSIRPFRALLRAAAALVVIPIATALAEESTKVPDVVVSATRSEQSSVTIPASITIIDREEIERSGAQNVTDVLRGRGAVQVSELFGDGSRPTVGLRGFNESANANTLVLVDGRRLNNTDIADPDFNSVSLKDVERIEIIQGSAGTLFGDQAVGGVINIITRTPRELRLFAEAGAGSFSGYSLRAGASQLLDIGLSYRFTAEKRESHNYRDNNELDYENFVGRVGFEYSSGSVFAELQQVKEVLGQPGALFAADVAADRRQVRASQANNFSDVETNVQRLGVRQSLHDNWSFEAELTNREVAADFTLTFLGAPISSPQSRHLVSFNPRLIGAHPTANGDLLVTLGHDVEWTDYELDVGVLVGQRNEQISRGTYGQVVLPVSRRTTLTLGARNASVENDLIDSGGFAVFPAGIEVDDTELITELGLAVRPTDRWRVFARRDENVRYAKVDEYLFADAGVLLRTQIGRSLEAGVEWNYALHSAKIVAYRLDLDNEIAFDPSAGPGGFGVNVNIAATRRDGLFLEGVWQATDKLRFSGDYSFIDARVSAGPLQGRRVPMVSEHMARVSMDYQINPYIQLHAAVHGVSDRVFSGDFNKSLGELPGHGVVNLATTVNFQGWTLSARVNNLLDNEYSDFGARAFDPMTFAPVESFFPSPERNFWLTLRYDYD